MISFNIKKNNIQRINKCLICSSKESQVISNVYYKNKFIIFQTSYCKKCLYIFRSRRPNIKWLEQAWKKREKIQTQKKINYINDVIEIKREQRYKKLFRFISQKIKFNSILDVGCGPGTGLKHLIKLKKKVYGIEPDLSRAKIAKKNHVKIVKGKIEDIKIKRKFDLVTCIQSLEHFYDPKKTLLSIKKIVKKNGFIFIEIPNYFNHVRSWHDCLYLGHMSNFIKESFLYLFLKCELKPLYLCYTQTGKYGEYNLGIISQNKSYNYRNNPNYINKGIQKKIKKLTLYGINNKKIKKKIPLNVNLEVINDLSLMYKPSTNIKSSLVENIFERGCVYNYKIKKYEITDKENYRLKIKTNRIDKKIKYKKYE